MKKNTYKKVSKATTSTLSRTRKRGGKQMFASQIYKSKGFPIVTAIAAILGIIVLGFLLISSRAATTATYWKPTADKPLKLSWILGGRINFNNPKDMGTVDSNGNPVPGGADVLDLDMEYTTAEDVAKLHTMGKKVICYFDAGVFEDYRKDAHLFPGTWGPNKNRIAQSAEGKNTWGTTPIPYNGVAAHKSIDLIGDVDDGWDGSYWLDIRQIEALKPIMQSRINACKSKGFDGIEPDEITNWSNDNGFDNVVVNGHAGITYQDQIAYNRALASWAHEAGMSIGLKGDLEQAHDLVNDFDWALIEECIQYSECTTITNAPDSSQVSGMRGADGKDYPGVQLFTNANKAVWIAEYTTIKDCMIVSKYRVNVAKYKLGLPEGGGYLLPCGEFPSRATSNPPSTTSVPPTTTTVPPTTTSVPPTVTSLPPTPTTAPPAATSIPPTQTPTTLSAPTFRNFSLDYAIWSFEPCSWKNNCKLTLSWSAVPGATSYDVIRPGKNTINTTTTSFVESPVNVFDSYTYQIKAKNSTQSASSPLVSKTVSCFQFFLYFCGVQ
ncbi:endo alpha-1,4 polygalactosaminidase [bacterium]|nr:endo alpha-1,4 polygalactosaminidase [bacterium]